MTEPYKVHMHIRRFGIVDFNIGLNMRKREGERSLGMHNSM